MFRWLANRIHRMLTREKNKRTYKVQQFTTRNERPLEYAFALESLASAVVETVLDVGAGKSAWPALMARCGFVVTAIDQWHGYWRRVPFNPHFHIIPDDITSPHTPGPFDAVTCISTLEHIPDHDAAVRGMFSLLKPGGSLILTVPYNEQRYVGNVYDLPEATYGKDVPYVCQVFSRHEVDGWLEQNGGRLVQQDFYQVFDGELWTFGSRTEPPLRVGRDDRHQLTALHLHKGAPAPGNP